MIAEHAAQHEARLDGIDAPGPLGIARRNAVYRSAIEANLDGNQPRAALALYAKAKGSLGELLATRMTDVATDVEAEDWIARQGGGQGGEVTEATAQEALSASDLSPPAQQRAYQKVQQQIASAESARRATLETLGASAAAATKALGTAPSSYRGGALAALADGYAAAGEKDTAATLRSVAEQETFLLGYAQSPTSAQRRRPWTAAPTRAT